MIDCDYVIDKRKIATNTTFIVPLFMFTLINFTFILNEG